MPIYEPAREKVIYENVRAANKGPLPDIELTHIFERIIDVMRALQRNELASQRNASGRPGSRRPGPRSRRAVARDGEQAMIVAMQEHATEEQIDAIIERMVEAGVNVHRTTGATQTILAGVGPTLSVDIEEYKLLPGVLSVHRISSPYKLAGRAFRPEGTIVEFNHGVKVGGDEIPDHGRAVLDRKPRADLPDRAAGQRGWRLVPSRRSLQAAQFAVCLPGHGHSWPQADARSGRCLWPAGHQRGHGDLADRAHAALTSTASR